MPSIVAVIVTYKRPGELRRLLDGLATSEVALAGCVISDHAPDGSTQVLAGETPFETHVLEDASNPGPGAGWANAAREALTRFPEFEAIWYLDDDVVISPTDLDILWAEMQRAQADAIAPLLTDAEGKIWAFPEPVPVALRRPIRVVTTPAEACQLLGGDPIPFCWCTGACFLVGRVALEQAGFHRSDFWMLGEDLEYSMRIASLTKAVFTCRAAVPHLPPKKIMKYEGGSMKGEQASDPTSKVQHSKSKIDQAGYIKFCALLQNLSYLSFHATESRHMKRYLPGNFRRFFRTQGFRWRTFRDACSCFWHGAFGGQPAGLSAGQSLRQRIQDYDG